MPISIFKIPIAKSIHSKTAGFLGVKKPNIFPECATDRFESTILRPDFGIINTPLNSFEYTNILRKLKHTIAHNGDFAYFTGDDLHEYGKIDLKLHGLIPYCGQDDCHGLINMYLSGRLTESLQGYWKQHMPYELDTIPEVVRLLEYSLQVLDKKYGTYKGIVYRNGIMSEKPSQYISTTLNPHIASTIHGGTFGIFDGSKHFSIIHVKNGHRIIDFQKEAGSSFANSEQEILMSFKSQYQELPNKLLTPELLELKENFASILYNSAKKFIPGGKENMEGYTKEAIYKLIQVYEQK